MSTGTMEKKKNRVKISICTDITRGHWSRFTKIAVLSLHNDIKTIVHESVPMRT